MRIKPVLLPASLAPLALVLLFSSLHVSADQASSTRVEMASGNSADGSRSMGAASISVNIAGTEYVPTNTTCRWDAEVAGGTPSRYQWYVNGDSISWGTLPWFYWHVEDLNIMLHLVVWEGAASDTAAMTVYVGMGDDCD